MLISQILLRLILYHFSANMFKKKPCVVKHYYIDFVLSLPL